MIFHWDLGSNGCELQMAESQSREKILHHFIEGMKCMPEGRPWNICIKYKFKAEGLGMSKCTN